MGLTVNAENPQVRFWVKLLFPIIGAIFFGLLVYPPSMWMDNKQKNKPREFKMTIPLRSRLMAMNTISAILLLLSVNEFNAYQVMEPVGVDSSRIPADCSTAQWIALVFLLFIPISFIFVYNFAIIYMLMAPNTSTRSNDDQDPRNSSDANSYKLEIKASFPGSFEIFICMFFGILSIGVNIGAICSNPIYQIGDPKPFRFCYHPLNLNRYVDPLAESTSPPPVKS